MRGERGSDGADADSTPPAADNEFLSLFDCGRGDELCSRCGPQRPARRVASGGNDETLQPMAACDGGRRVLNVYEGMPVQSDAYTMRHVMLGEKNASNNYETKAFTKRYKFREKLMMNKLA